MCLLADLTWLDKYVLGSNCFIAAILLQVAVQSYTQSYEDDAPDFDSKNRVLLVSNAAVWLMAHIFLSLHVALWVLPFERAKLKMSSVDHSAEKNVKDNLVVLSGKFEAVNLVELATVQKGSHPDPDRDTKRGNKADAAAQVSIYRGGLTGTEHPDSHPLSGVYKSDFGHGIETFGFSVIHVGHTERLIGRKITGDPNVPAGRLSQVTVGIPEEGGDEVSGICQCRDDIDDSDAFYGVPTKVTLTEGDIVSIVHRGEGDIRRRVFTRV